MVQALLSIVCFEFSRLVLDAVVLGSNVHLKGDNPTGQIFYLKYSTMYTALCNGNSQALKLQNWKIILESVTRRKGTCICSLTFLKQVSQS